MLQGIMRVKGWKKERDGTTREKNEGRRKIVRLNITKLKFVSLELLLTTSSWLTWQEVILSMWNLRIPETDWIPFLVSAVFRVQLSRTSSTDFCSCATIRLHTIHFLTKFKFLLLRRRGKRWSLVCFACLYHVYRNQSNCWCSMRFC